jgi:hypothetical protein
MGGRIWVRPRPGGGSEFAFWLPRYAGAPDELIELEPDKADGADGADGADAGRSLEDPATPASKE